MESETDYDWNLAKNGGSGFAKGVGGWGWGDALFARAAIDRHVVSCLPQHDAPNNSLPHVVVQFNDQLSKHATLAGSRSANLRYWLAAAVQGLCQSSPNAANTDNKTAFVTFPDIAFPAHDRK